MTGGVYRIRERMPGTGQDRAGQRCARRDGTDHSRTEGVMKGLLDLGWPARRSPVGMTPRYCTFAVTEVAAFSVRLQLFVFCPPLEQAPDHMASRPLLTLSVTDMPVAKLALPVVPTFTLSPAGLEETDSPERPVAVTVSCAVDADPPPQTLGTPPPPHVCGAVHVPQSSVPLHPFEMEPQFLP
jgi:hypothetical protein